MSTPAADGVGQAIDGYHTFNVNSLLPKNKCSAPLGGKVYIYIKLKSYEHEILIKFMV